ncbi:MAG: hypothetical protein U1A72_13300 [Sulfuritalea sp.]|nr:hypothetical protein [Sulfuritalea sp.]
MAVANTKSTIVTNADADPKKFNAKLIAGGVLKEAVGTVEVAAADDDDSVYRFCRVHSSWRPSQLQIASDAITGGTDFDIGLHDIAATNSGAVVDADLFASAVDLSSASALTDRLYEATATNISKIEKAIWELLALASDPGKFYDLTATGNTVGTAAGTIAVALRYTDGD